MTTNSESKSETTGAVKAKRDEYRTLPLSELAPDPDQPRKHFDDAKLAELGENLKTAGVLVPLLVRPHPKPAEAAKTLFLLVDGERRWRAAQLAGLKEMPCLVRAMTDLEALETQGLTQLQREDLTAMEEARWMARLVEGGAHTRESLAAKLGIQRTTVYNRLRLARATGPLAAAVESGKLDATKAVAILGIPDSKGQAECLKVALEEDWDGNVMSFRNLERLIESSYRRPLKDAPWDLKTEQLGGQCSCASCPKRSGNMTEEYPQLKASPNVCTELACWEKKKQAHISQVLEKARSAGQQGLTPKEFELAERQRTFVRLEEKNWDDPKHRTYGECLAATTKNRKSLDGTPAISKVIVAVDDNGNRHELAEPQVLREAGVPMNPAYNQASTNGAGGPAARAKEALEAKIDEAVNAAAVAKVETPEGRQTAGFWGLLLDALLQHASRDTIKPIARRRCPGERTAEDAAKQFERHVTAMTSDAQRIGLIVEIAVLNGVRGPWGLEDQRQAMLKLLKVNVEKIEATVKEEAKAKKTASTAKTEPKPIAKTKKGKSRS